MEFLNYEEQALIKMNRFSSKEELKDKLKVRLSEVQDEDMQEVIRELIIKIDKFSLEDLKNIDNLYE